MFKQGDNFQAEGIEALDKANVPLTAEVSTSKYNHIINDFHDQLFQPSRELKIKTDDNESRNHFSAVKEMYMRGLGLNVKIAEKKRKHNARIDLEKNKKISDYSSPTTPTKHNKETNYENEVKTACVDDAYCKNTKTIVFHLTSRKIAKDTKNAVLKPLSKKITGNHRKRHKYERSIQKINSSENAKVSKEPIKHGDTAIEKDIIIPENDCKVSDDTQVMHKLNNKIDVSNKLKEHQVIENVKTTRESKQDEIYEKNYLIHRKIAKQRLFTRRTHSVCKIINNIRKETRLISDNKATHENKEIEALQQIGTKVDYENSDNNLKTNRICEEVNKNNSKIEYSRVITRRMSSLINNHENNVSSNKKPTVNNTFTCNECGRNLKSKLLLITHIKDHSKKGTGAKNRGIILKYPYSLLTKKSNTKTTDASILPLKLARYNLASSVSKKCTEKTYKYCTLCNYKTPYDSRMSRHNRKHTKSYECKHCRKLFRKTSDLKVHLRSHTGQKPFRCHCGAAFARKNSLNRHLRTHTSEKSFKCTICTSEFKLLNGLKRHLKIHGEKTFKCTICGTSFNDGSSLKRHTMRHIAEKPYSCDRCKYSTANKHDLRRHAKTCKGNKLTRQL